jgi:hypothetical protein
MQRGVGEEFLTNIISVSPNKVYDPQFITRRLVKT